MHSEDFSERFTLLYSETLLQFLSHYANSFAHRSQFGRGYRATHVTQAAVGHHQQTLGRYDASIQDSAEAIGNLLRLLDMGLLHVDEGQSENFVPRELTVRVHLSKVPMGRLEMDGSDIRRCEHRHHFRCFIFPDIGLRIHAAIADMPDRDKVIQAFEHAVYSLDLPQVLGIRRENVDDLYGLQPSVPEVLEFLVER